MSGLPRRVAEWYANSVAVLLFAALLPLAALVFEIGPTALVAAFGVLIAIAIAVLLGSLVVRSDRMYRLLTTAS